MSDDKFPKPLDQWVDEEVEVPVMTAVHDRRGNIVGIKQSTAKRKVKTIYTKAEPRAVACAQGKHNWFMKDRHKHIAACKNPGCTKHRYLRAIFETIDKEGHIIDRDTKQIID